MVSYGATECADSARKNQSRSCSAGFARYVFMFIFLLVTLPSWVYTAIGDACWYLFGCFCCCWADSPKWRRRRGQVLAHVLSCSWRLAFLACSCWLRVESSGVLPLEEAGRKGRSVFVAVNHASFLDAPVVCAYAPWSLVGNLKTLMAREHLKLPVMGRLAEAIQHMPVPFHSNTRGSLSVDKEEMSKIIAQVDEHVGAGGHLGIFPEGDLNKNWNTLMTFRAGGLEIAIRHDMEVWGWVLAGTADSWPVGEMLGGSPAHVRTAAKLLHGSAAEAGKRLCGPDSDTRTQAEALAQDIQTSMQDMLNSLLEGSSEP